jgi:hypothetical protein
MSIGPMIFNIANLIPAIPGRDNDSVAAKASNPTAGSSPAVALLGTPPAAIASPAASFTFSVDPVNQFTTRINAKIKKAKKEKTSLNAHTARQRRLANSQTNPRARVRFQKKARRTAADNLSQIGEKDILIWILKRSVGAPISNNNLLRDLRRIRGGTGVSAGWGPGRNRYWPPQLALILSSGLDNPANRQTLASMLWNGSSTQRQSFIRQCKTNIRLAQRMALKKIYSKYLSGKTSLTLLRIQYHISLALIEKGIGNRMTYLIELGKAKRLLTTVLTISQRLQGSNIGRRQKAALITQLNRYIPYITINAKDKTERKKYIAQLNFMMAKVLMFEAENGNNPTRSLAKLREAIPYMARTAVLKGINQLEIRQLYAENIIRQGYTLREQRQPYLNLMIEARQQLDYITDWVGRYKTSTGTANISKWVLGIQTTAEITRANIIMVFAGDINQQPSQKLFTLLGKELGSANIAKLKRGVAVTEALNIQMALLVKAEGILRAVLKRTNIVNFESRAGVQISLAENLARQGFIRRGLGMPNHKSLIKGAATILNGLFTPGASVATRASANLWLAKIYFVLAGDETNLSARNKLLKHARKHIRFAIKSKKLKGSVLSSAYQTYGEVLMQLKNLRGAERMLRQAIKINKQNYGAMASLADILNQRKKYTDAISIYKKLKSRRAQLGLAEVMMRRGENYSLANINKLRSIVLAILTKEPPGSYLIIRGIQDLVEAYSTKEHLQELIILIGKTVLKLDNLTAITDGPLQTAINQALARKVVLSDIFKAKLYLQVAEALTWRKKYDKAKELLLRIPAAILTTITKNRRLALLSRILRAELEMEEKKDDANIRRIKLKIMDPTLERDIMASNNPYLIIRLIKDQIVACYTQKKFAKALRIINKYLVPANNPHIKKIEQLFAGRPRSFSEFIFHLKLEQANSLFYSRNYAQALKKYKAILVAINKIEKKNKALALKLRARVYLNMGEIYFIKEKYALARTNYHRVVTLLKNSTSKRANLDRAKALIGLGEIARYAPGLEDLAASRSFYEQAEKSLRDVSSQNPRRIDLEGRIAKGMFAVRGIFGDVFKIWSSLETFHGANDGLSEMQWIFGGSFRLSYLTSKLRDWHTTLNVQLDLAKNEEGKTLRLTTPYIGLRYLHVAPPNWSISAGLEGRIGPVGRTFGNVKLGDKIVFTNQPDLKLNLFIWSKWVSFGMAANIEVSSRENAENMSTFNVALMKNFAYLKKWWIKGLSLGIDYNYFNFTYLGDFTKMHSIGLGGRYDLEIYKSDRGNFRATLNARLKQLFYHTNGEWHYGVEGGAGLRLDIYNRFRLDANYTRTQTQEYPINRFMLNATFQF